MQARNDPNATYVDIEAFTRQVREDKIRSEREYMVFHAAGMLDGTFPPDPVACYVTKELNALERYLWWRVVLGPRCIEKPPNGFVAEEAPKPARVPRVPTPPVSVPEAKAEAPPEPAKPKQQRRVVRRPAPKAEQSVEPPKPTPKDPYPQRTGPPAQPKPPKPQQQAAFGTRFGAWSFEWNEDD